MKLTDAKKILSGEFVSYPGSQEVCVVKKGGNSCDDWRYIDLTPKDITFMLLQLALKVVGEKEKGK